MCAEIIPPASRSGAIFRSRKGVTGMVNFLFRQLMSRQLGEMEYTQEEALVPAAPVP